MSQSPPLIDMTTTVGAVPFGMSDLMEELYNVIVERRDGDQSLIRSASNFEDLGLPEEILRGVYDCKFAKPSKIQASAIPLLNTSENLIAQAQSGTGKTAAFVLATLRAIDWTVPKTQAIVMVPTRELARQVVAVILQLGKYTPVRVQAAIPEYTTPNHHQQQQLQQQQLLQSAQDVHQAFSTYFTAPSSSFLARIQEAFQPLRRGEATRAHIVVGTPGRIGDVIKRRMLQPSSVRILILDEADHMLNFQGLAHESIKIIRLLPINIQKVLFSATWRDQMLEFAQRFAGANANRITLRMNEVALRTIVQFYMDCRDTDHRFELLVSLYTMMTVSQSIIFVQRRCDADEIAARMIARRHIVTSLHGGMSPAERDRRLDAFRSGASKVLIATNVLARGLDVANVNVVINYDLPITQAGHVDPEAYLHRIGRTGRFGRTGVAVNFVHSPACAQGLRLIADTYSCDILGLPTDSVDSMENVLRSAVKGHPPSPTTAVIRGGAAGYGG